MARRSRDTDSNTDTDHDCLANNNAQPDTNAHSFSDCNANSHTHPQPDAYTDTDHHTELDTVVYAQHYGYPDKICTDAYQPSYQNPHAFARTPATEPRRRSNILGK